MKQFWTDLWWLMLFVAIGFVITICAMFGLNSWFGWELAANLTQWIQNIVALWLPAWLWVRIYKKERARDVFRLGWPGWKVMGLVFVLMVVSAPAVDAFDTFCDSLPLPEAIRQYALQNRAQQEVLLKQLLAGNRWTDWLVFVSLMCVMTGIAEEMLFRGALLRCYGTTLTGGKLVSAALWVGLVFSAFHVEVFGFIPRWVLGAAFVLLVCRTGSIWPAVLAHALNNFWAILSMKVGDSETAPSPLGDWMSGAVAVSISVVLCAVVIWAIVRATRPQAERLTGV